MGLARNVWVTASSGLVLWACATTKEVPTEGANGGGLAGRGGNVSASGGVPAGGVFGGSRGGASSGGANPSGGRINSGGTGDLGGAGSGGVPASVLERASVILHYETNQASASTNKIHMRLFLENKSVDPLPLASVAIRYWMTSEVSPPTLHNYYSGPSIQGQTQTFVEEGADSYVELTFTGSAVARGVDLNSSEMQLDVDGGNYDQSDDWSWEPAYSTRAPHDKLTVYLATKLIWGCEPSGACASDGAGGAGGAGGAAGSGGAGGTAGAPGTAGAGGDSGGSGPSAGGASGGSDGGSDSQGGSGALGGADGQGGMGGA